MHSIKNKLLLGVSVLLAVSLLSGCSANARFYPVEGPVSTQTPLPVFAGKMTVNPDFKSARFTAVLSDGETFQGPLLLVHSNKKGRTGSATEAPPMAEGMDAAWDTVYGKGYYVAHVLGEGQYGRSAITGSKGTVLQMEIHSDVSNDGAQVVTSQPKGVAKDSKGNLYKVVFG